MKRTRAYKSDLLNMLTKNVRLQLEDVTGKYDLLPPDMLNKSAIDGGWSIAQCLEHLNTYSAYYLSLIKSAIQRYNHENTVYKSTLLGAYLNSLMGDDGGGKKYKAKPRHQPAAILNAREVVERFKHYQVELLQYVREAEKTDLNKGRLPVSINPFLKLSLGDVLVFMELHQKRHLAQAARNLASQRLLQRINHLK